MDPNATLKSLRAAAQAILRNYDSLPDNGLPDAVNRVLEAAFEVADYFDSLDNWLKRGGFYPNDWNPKQEIRNGDSN